MQENQGLCLGFGYHVSNSFASIGKRRCKNAPYRRISSVLMSTSNSVHRKRIAVIGGGASGMFAATAAADYVQKHSAHACDVVVFEGTSKTMSKVRISGGGRVSKVMEVYID